jgi:S-adenosylmethionine:tRNA ribosyltransferase-isomerase
MLTSDFDYELPPELIAQEPPAERGASRMMVLHRSDGWLEHRSVADLPEYLRAGDLLVLNDTKVFPARIFGKWADTGGTLELLLIEPRSEVGGQRSEVGGQRSEVGGQRSEVGGRRSEGEEADCRPLTSDLCSSVWMCITGSGRPVRAGQRAVFAEGRLEAEILVKNGNGTWDVCFTCAEPLMEILDRHGQTPVPPYIHRHGDERQARLDRERYQTVYARETGAVAAPTAGLHFTEALFAALEAKGVQRATVTLHVGPGTFKPVKTGTVEAHRMDPERYAVPHGTAEAVAACRARGGRVVCVGSTSVRTLESVAAAHGGRVVETAGSSTVFIYPPYRFQATDAMLTNFHLPQSTLIMMVSALAGRERILAAYREAVRERYRFFSYGDCMLIV